MALYELTLTGEYYGQQTINRWNYQMSGTPAAVSGSFALAYAFGAIAIGDPLELPLDTVNEAIRALVSNAYRFVSVQVFNVYDYVDFYTTPYPVNTMGAQVGDGLSPTAAYGFRTNRTRRDIRRATKRFAGVTEMGSSIGGEIASGHQTLMGVVASYMSANLNYDDEGNTITFSPVVVSKQRLVDPETGKVKYVYYESETEQEQHLMSSIIWEPYTTTRTQVSRQYGKGV